MIGLERKWTAVKCDNCKSQFEKRNCEIKRRSKHHFCSVDCKRLYFRHSSPKKKPIDFEIKNGCFECTSHKPGKRGYPRIHKKLVYRHVYEEMKGPIPKGLVIRHTCDNKMCINPEHLILGTQTDNMNDALERNRFPLGSERPNAKINEHQAREIKKLILAGVKTDTEIGKMFGVNRYIVRNIKAGRTWKHVNIS